MAIIGSDGNDFLTGTTGADTISGLDGIDEISGGKGADLIYGGPGEDRIDGGDGNDRIDGGDGDDNLGGGNGNDSIVGGQGNDALGGGSGEDTLAGGDDNDVFFSWVDGGSDRFFGGAGNDTFDGSTRGDTLDGGAGDDYFLLSYVYNNLATATGGSGRDLYVIEDGAALGVFPNFSPDTFAITDFAAGPGGDLINIDEFLLASGQSGYEGGNPFSASLGFFRLVQSGSNVLLQWDNSGAASFGSEWQTVLTLRNLSKSSLTADNFVGGIPPDGSQVPGDDYTGTAGADTLEGGFFNDTLNGLDGDDALDGRGGNDVISGGSGNDTIEGGAGNDQLNGGDGDDLFVVASAGTASQATGGAGVDTYRLDIGFLKENRGYSVTDFATGAGGDQIDVNPLLIHSFIPYGTLPVTFGYTGGNPFDPASGYLRFVQSGTDVKLQWDRDGPDDDFAGWQTVLTLKNRQVSDLTVDNMVSWIPPDGSITPGQTISGGSGNDQLLGSIFGDDISGLDGNDVLRGNAGNDVVDGGAGDDSLAGGLGNDTVFGGAGNDRFKDIDKDEPSSLGNDRLYGGTGDDEFQDQFGNNRLYGEDGNDSFGLGSGGGIFWSGADTVTGGAGSDLYGLNVDMNRFVDVKDRVTDFTAGPGGDLLDVGLLPMGHGVFKSAFDLGHLRLFQSGAHTLLQFDLDGAADNGFGWITLLTLNNVTASSITSDNFLGELVVGTSGNDDLVGGLGNDTVQGLAGSDTLDGSLGKDTLEGGSGDDLYYVDHIDDVVVETSNDAPGALGIPDISDTVIAAVNYSLASLQYVENLSLAGAASRATGNALANNLKGNAGNDTLDGGGGNDTLDGGAGSDRLYGGDGNDTLVWASTDSYDGGADTDTLKVRAGNLNLTTVANTKIKNVEQIDLTGGGNNTLTLALADVLAISSTTDTLKVLGAAGDSVDIVGPFTAMGAPVGGFRTYQVGTGFLQVDTDMIVT